MNKQLRESETGSVDDRLRSNDEKLKVLTNKLKELQDQVENNKVQANAAQSQSNRATGVNKESESQDRKMKQAMAAKARSDMKYYQDELKKVKDEIDLVNQEKVSLLDQKRIKEQDEIELTKEDILKIVEESEPARMRKSDLIEHIQKVLISEDMNDDIRRKIESGETDYSQHLDRDTIKRMADGIMNDIKSNLENRVGRGANFNVASMTMYEGLMGSLTKESRHRNRLEQLAVRLVCEEYDIPEDAVDFEVQITGEEPIRREGLKMNRGTKRPPQGKTEEELKPNVTKRRLMNAMMHGAARKGQNLFHMATQELNNIDPSLVNDYSKLMAGNDFMYWSLNDETIKNEGERGTHAGQVKVDLSGEKPKIIAKGMTFPFLLHELTKGVLELMSLHGLDTDADVREYVLDKTDNLESEAWDIRLGPKIWEKFLDALDNDDLPYKSHIFHKVSTLSPDEFNKLINGLINDKEEARSKVRQIADEVIHELNQEEVDQLMDTSSYEEEDEDIDDEPTEPSIEKDEEEEEIDPSTWSKKELNDAINNALEDEDYATVDYLQKIMDRKYK